MEGEANEAAGEVELGVSAGQENHGGFVVRTVVASTGFGHVNDGGIVEEGAVAFWNGLELGDQSLDLLHVMGLDHISHVGSTTVDVAPGVADCAGRQKGSVHCFLGK